MKAKFNFYLIVWVALLVMFHVVVFVTPNEIAGLSKFGGAFWVGYVFVLVVFLCQLGVTWYAWKDDVEKTFYHIPMIQSSYGTLIVMMLMGTACMVIPQFPIWLGIIFCLLILAFGFISVVKTQAAIETVEEIDTKIKNKTVFIKVLTADIEDLMSHTEVDNITEELKKVYDTVKYSDPVSREALSDIETQITLKVNELADAIQKEDIETVKNVAKELIILLNDRNKKCMILK